MAPRATCRSGFSRARSAVGQVENVEQDLHAGEVVVQVDVEPRDALGRLIGEQERGDERHEFAGSGIEHQHAIAGIEKHDPDGDPAQRFHQRRRAVRYPGELVRGGLDAFDALVHARTHDRFEIERLDDAEALDRLLHRLEDLGAAAILGEHDGAHPLDQLAHTEDRRRHDHDADQRHERRLIDHDRDEPDQRQQVASQRIDQQVEDLRRRTGAEGDARGEFRGVAIGIEGDVLLEQLVEHPLLVFGDDVIGDAGHGDGLAIGREPLDGEDDDHRHCDDRDAVEAAVDIGLVDAAAEQQRRQRGAGGPDRHEGERQAVAPPMGAAVLGQ